jgi:hypothetical protein
MLNQGVSGRLAGLSRTSKDTTAKLLVIVVFSAVLLALALMNAPGIPQDMAPEDLHVSWITSLAATLQQGQVSGRDFNYTYGPLSQALAYLAVTLTRSNSALAGFPSIVVAFRAAGILLLGLILTTVWRVGAAQSALIYACFLVLNVFSSPYPLALLFTYRAFALLLCGVLLARTLASVRPSRRMFAAGLLGAACFGAQLITAELAVYAVLATVAVCCFFAFAAWRPSVLRRSDLLTVKDYLTVALISVGVLAGLNLLTGVLFKLTSPNYVSLFDYQTNTWQLMSGYNNTMGVPWALSAWTTAVLSALALFSICLAALSIRETDLGGCYMMVSLLAFSLAFSRQATLRSDIGHILSGFVPVVLTFLLFLRYGRKNWLLLAAWVGLLVLLLITWPVAGWSGVAQLGQAFTGKFALADKLSQFANGSGNPQIATDLAQTLGDTSRPMLNFPSENYISVAMNRRMVAPVILAHNAHTTALQREYVAELDRLYGKLDVTYSLDDVSSAAIDDVQHITRLPIIFEYLYDKYAVRTDQSFGRGIYVLTPREQPTVLQATPLEARLQAWNGNRLVARLARPAQCALVRLTLQVDYPLTRYLGRPNPLVARFKLGDSAVHDSGVVAIEVGAPFTTYVSLLAPPAFYLIFSAADKPDRNWDSLVIEQRSTGLFEVTPTNVIIKKLECVTG